MRAFVAVAFAALLVCGAEATQATEARAQAWLAAHRAAQPDELSDYAKKDPEGYALVKSLMMKQSLGLLDPRHPHDSSSKAHHDENKPHENVFAKFETPKDQSVTDSSAVFPDAPAPSKHHNWMSWKPADSATDDDLVQSVSGAAKKQAEASKAAPTVLAPVAAPAALAEPVKSPSVAGSFLSKKHDLTVYNKEPEHEWKHMIDPNAVSVLTNDEMEFGISNPDVDEAAGAESAPAQRPQASMSQTNSYMKSINFNALTGQDDSEPVVAVSTPKPAPKPEAPKPVAAAPVEKKKHSFLNEIGFARVASSFAPGGAASSRSLADEVAEEMPSASLPVHHARKASALSEDSAIVSHQPHDDLTDFLGGNALHIMARKASASGSVIDRYAQDLE